jgi:hypothetical protein
MAVAKTNGSDYTTPPNLKGSGSVNGTGAATRLGSASSTMDSVDVTRKNGAAVGSVVLDDSYSDKAVSGGAFAYNNQRPVGMRTSSTIAGIANTTLLSGADTPGLVRSIAKREAYRVVKTATAFRNGLWNPFVGAFVERGTWSRTAYTITVTIPSHGFITGDKAKFDFVFGTGTVGTDGIYSITNVDANTFTVTDTVTGSATGSVFVYGPAGFTETQFPASGGGDLAANPTRSAPGQLTYKGGALNPVTTNDYKSKTG